MNEYKYLNNIQFPEDLRKYEVKELPEICREVREYIIDTLSGVGGHFASNLGAVELTVALHYVYNTPRDRLIWDVGHQTYPHKILTGRREKLKTVRKYGGISGFPKREESEYDLYNTGHAGTSISQLIGEAIARDMVGEDYKCVAIIGDASMATGMALEAMNHCGHVKPSCLVLLNDNFMSISKNVGSISNYLNNIISSRRYNRWKKSFYTFIKWLPIIGPALASFSKRVERGLKDMMTPPGGLFEDLGFNYIGPIDGHDVVKMVDILNELKNREGPVLLHIITQKGKGYKPAENDPIKYHGVTPFNKLDGSMQKKGDEIGFSNIIGECLIRLTEKNQRVVAITPAMIEGSGLKEYHTRFPKHVHDVGIAEQHSVAYAGALLGGGIIPYMCIYSTFLTRAIDQVVHDVSLMNLPVRFVIDRAGCVGPDGETHQGLSDISYLASLPNMSIIAPSSGQDLIDAMFYMETYNEGPIAIRFPKDSASPSSLNFTNPRPIQKPTSRLLKEGSDVLLISVGSMLDVAKKVAEKLEASSIKAGILDLFWIRPLDMTTIKQALDKTRHFVILDESYLDGGVTGFFLTRLDAAYLAKYLKTFAFPQEIIVHGDRDNIFKHYGIDADSISGFLLNYLKPKMVNLKEASGS
ncbi:MAG: 1-deoxy-D-xylulose-5-phosphate synthase [Leptospiraceae bacterium]|nr:1-deoxy-D-xylulose-5-phosphate synthase [Leptospiraceae bacterium]